MIEYWMIDSFGYFIHTLPNSMTYLQVISLAGWVNIMYYIQDAHSFWDWIYFVALIIVSHRCVHSVNKCAA